MNKNNLIKSEEYLKRAKNLIPCQTQTLSKGYTQFVQGVCPVYLEKGDGSKVWDVDGNMYTDYMMGLCQMILGYNNKQVNNAIIKQLSKGISFSLPHPLEIDLAEKFKKIIPCADMVRYAKNGSDVTSGAVRLARAHTGKEKIAFCGYHGWHDWYIASTDKNIGVPKMMNSLCFSFKYNDIASLEKLLFDHKNEIAAVIMEPIGVEEPKNNFLENILEMSHKNNAVLIFDEVITGFRVSLGGAQEYYGVTPDLACFGKAVANGMPLSVIAGKRNIMTKFEDVFFSMTSGGETLSLAAAIATINEIESKNVIEDIWKKGTKLKQGIISCLEQYKNLNISCNGLPVHFCLAFKDNLDIESLELKSLFIQEMVERGILTPGYFNISHAHSEEDVEKTILATNETFKIMDRAVKEGNVSSFLKGPCVQPVFRRL